MSKSQALFSPCRPQGEILLNLVPVKILLLSKKVKFLPKCDLVKFYLENDYNRFNYKLTLIL